MLQPMSSSRLQSGAQLDDDHDHDGDDGNDDGNDDHDGDDGNDDDGDGDDGNDHDDDDEEERPHAVGLRTIPAPPKQRRKCQPNAPASGKVELNSNKKYEYKHK